VVDFPELPGRRGSRGIPGLDTDPYYAPFYEQAKDIEPTDMPIVAWNEMRVFPDGPLNVLANRVWGTKDDMATIFADGHKAISDILAKYA
jgi:hypothetical protein